MSDSGAEPAQAVQPRPDQPLAVPPPPPGPGVVPPFVAPPTDGLRKRRWTAIGLSAGAAVLFCVAGVAGFGGLVYLGVQMLSEQAQGTVSDYLTALRDEEYGLAYELLCDDLQASTSPGAFARNASSGPRVEGFEVGNASLATNPVEVPATIDYVDGDVRTVRFVMVQDTNTGGFEVCGEAD
jgi:hypothetical protein